jgi:hypothetical protein
MQVIAASSRSHPEGGLLRVERPRAAQRWGHVDVPVEKERRRVAAAGQAADHVEAIGGVADQLSGNTGAGEDIPAIRGAIALVSGWVGGVEAYELLEEIRNSGVEFRRR